MADVPGERIRRQADAVVVAEFALDLGDRPVPRTATVTDPTEDIPADGPLGQGDGDLEFGALGPGVTGAAGVGTVVELADQLDRPLRGVDAPVSVVTDIHP